MAKSGKLLAVAGLAAFGTVALVAWAQDKKEPQQKKENQEQERKVTEAEVPKAALEALKKLADKAALTEFSEEIEHGHKFYEGSWTGATGKVDALVTETGDLVELEEKIPAEKAPSAVRGAVEKEAGKDAQVGYEKKTFVMYEVHFRKDGKGREMIFTPDGRRFHEEGDDDGDEDEDD